MKGPTHRLYNIFQECTKKLLFTANTYNKLHKHKEIQMGGTVADSELVRVSEQIIAQYYQ